jgi:hypothetical protein
VVGFFFSFFNQDYASSMLFDGLTKYYAPRLGYMDGWDRNRIRIGSRHCLTFKGWDCGVNWGLFSTTTRSRIRQIYLFTISIIKYKSGEKPRYTLKPSRSIHHLEPK